MTVQPRSAHHCTRSYLGVTKRDDAEHAIGGGRHPARRQVLRALIQPGDTEVATVHRCRFTGCHTVVWSGGIGHRLCFLPHFQPEQYARIASPARYYHSNLLAYFQALGADSFRISRSRLLPSLSLAHTIFIFSTMLSTSEIRS